MPLVMPKGVFTDVPGEVRATQNVKTIAIRRVFRTRLVPNAPSAVIFVIGVLLIMRAMPWGVNTDAKWVSIVIPMIDADDPNPNPFNDLSLRKCP